MITFHTEGHRSHAPGVWLFKGGIAAAAEVPQRADVLLQEGAYLSPQPGPNLQAALRGCESVHR